MQTAGIWLSASQTQLRLAQQEQHLPALAALMVFLRLRLQAVHKIQQRGFLQGPALRPGILLLAITVQQAQHVQQ